MQLYLVGCNEPIISAKVLAWVPLSLVENAKVLLGKLF
jgi:hypothetical protein